MGINMGQVRSPINFAHRSFSRGFPLHVQANVDIDNRALVNNICITAPWRTTLLQTRHTNAREESKQREYNEYKGRLHKKLNKAERVTGGG